MSSEKIKWTTQAAMNPPSPTEQNEKLIQQFFADLRQILLNLLEKIQSNTEKKYGLYDKLPCFGGLTISRVSQLQDIYRLVRNLELKHLFQYLAQINILRKRYVRSEKNLVFSVWDQDGIEIYNQLTELISKTVAKYPPNSKIQIWWRRQQKLEQETQLDLEQPWKHNQQRFLKT